MNRASSLLIGALCFLLSGILAEAVLRYRYRTISQITGVAEWKTARSEDGHVYGWDQFHPKLGWTNLPSFRSEDGFSFQVSINRQGLRSAREYGAKTRPRVLFFGDSLVFGDEVNDDETVPYFLEQALECCEVLNLGVHSYGVGQMLLRLEERAAEFEPDHILVGVLVPQDLARDRHRFYTHAKPMFFVENGELAASNLPVPIWDGLPWLARHSYLFAALFHRPTESFESAKDLAEGMEVFTHMLFRMKEKAESMGAEFSVVLLTNGDTLRERGQYYRLMKEIEKHTKKLPFQTLSLLSGLEEQFGVHGATWMRPNGHWNASANRWISEQVATKMGVPFQD